MYRSKCKQEIKLHGSVNLFIKYVNGNKLIEKKGNNKDLYKGHAKIIPSSSMKIKVDKSQLIINDFNLNFVDSQKSFETSKL